METTEKYLSNLTGEITGIDKDAGVFLFENHNGTFRLPLNDSILETVEDAVKYYGDGTYPSRQRRIVLLDCYCSGFPNDPDTITYEVTKVKQVGIDISDIKANIKRLSELEHGWNDGSSGPITKYDVEWLNKFFCEWYPDDVKLPYLIPAHNLDDENVCDVEMDWYFTEWAGNFDKDAFSVSLDVEMKTHKGLLCIYNGKYWDTIENLNLDDEKNRELLFERLRNRK